MSAFLVDAPASFIGVSGVWGPAMLNGAPSITFPLKEENNYARLYAQPFIVHSGVDTTGAQGAPGIFPNTFLVAESDRLPLAGGFVAFDRYYAEIPSGFDDYQTIAHTFPALNLFRTEQYTANVVLRVYNDFILTGSPQNVPLSGAQRWRNVYGFDTDTLSTITIPTATTYSGWVGSGIEILPQDATISRYMGPMWRRQTYYVKAK